MNRQWIRRQAAALAAGLLIGSAALTVSAAPSQKPAPLTLSPLKPLSVRANASCTRVFIRLPEPSVAEANLEAARGKGTFLSRVEQQQQAALVDEQQRAFRPFLDSLGATVVGALRISANGLHACVGADKIDALRKHPGVRSVGRVAFAHVTNESSVPGIGAPQVWNELKVKGRNVKFGIIDTGIDYTHANFGGSGNPADYAAIDPDVVTPGTFPTAKVKGGIDLAGRLYSPSDDPTSVPHRDDNPFDVGGHGSHVAGTAAGIGVPGLIGPGVAPEADLFAIKVFGDGARSTDIVSEGIEWATDPNGDGDTSDRLDVINMSLGQDFGDPNDPSAIAAQNAAALGIIVVAASGNTGAVPYVTGSPAVAPSVISVAATTPGGRSWSRVTVTAPAAVAGVKANEEGTGIVQLRNTGPISGALVRAVPDNGCTPFSNAPEIAGEIALVRRGICTFNEKYLAAQAAGARAIVVYNDGADPTRIDPFAMTVDDRAITIPGFMIGSTDGFAIAAAATTTSASPVHVSLDAVPDPARDDRVASFSSRGPGSGGSLFKPEISAPGVAIASTRVGTGTEAVFMDGTSMAAPHVAGAAALLRELHPSFGADAIKAILLNSTSDANPSGDTDLSRQGVGVMDVDRAAERKSYAAPGAVSFGRWNPDTSVLDSRRVTVHDFSGTPRTFTVQTVPHHTYPGVTVSCQRSVSVAANGSSTFGVFLAFDRTVAREQGVSDDWNQSEREVDGWCVLKDAKDTLRVGFLMSFDAASGVSAVPVRAGFARFGNDGPATGLAQGFTLFGLDESAAGSNNGVTHLGVRHTATQGSDRFEFAIALREIFENLSTLQFVMDLDTDGDGLFNDVRLEGADLSQFVPGQPVGTFVTAQTDLKNGGGFLDSLALWDFNDRGAILPYTTAANADPGLVPSKFGYRLTVTGPAGEIGTLEGKVDMSTDVVPNLNDFTLEPGESAEVGFSGSGKTMWFLPGNAPARQVVVVPVSVQKK